MALYGMEVIDCGVAVLNMHAPWEIVSKADVYETKKGYIVFLEDAFSVKSDLLKIVLLRVMDHRGSCLDFFVRKTIS